MLIMDIFCGTKCVSKAAEKMGFESYSIDIEPKFIPSKVFDMLDPLDKEILNIMEKADIIFMSPPCNTLSMACGNRYFNADHSPKDQRGKDAIALLNICAEIASYAERNDKYYVVENPRARARWFLPEFNRQTVWYCQYECDRAKPTDIWTNIPFIAKTCKNNSPTCHHKKAPRGSTTGTQGRTIEEKYSIPEKLICELISNAKNKYK
ncbi:hypothetical protein KO361_05980 [Candidatus Woesearchaeota archaeon]|nr:hypothetical protein [Candidatus Woesearchaeota archaeon]